MNKLITLGLALLIAASTGQAETAKAPVYRPVNLGCANPGSHQDVAKTPIITNTTNHDLAASVKIYWNATDGDSGYLYGPLKVGESKSAIGDAGNAYSCQAYYLVRIP